MGNAMNIDYADWSVITIAIVTVGVFLIII